MACFTLKRAVSDVLAAHSKHVGPALARIEQQRKGQAALRLAKDVTGALRARRYRRKRNGNETNASVTVDAVTVTAISTVDMCVLAARLGAMAEQRPVICSSPSGC